APGRSRSSSRRSPRRRPSCGTSRWASSRTNPPAKEPGRLPRPWRTRRRSRSSSSRRPRPSKDSAVSSESRQPLPPFEELRKLPDEELLWMYQARSRVASTPAACCPNCAGSVSLPTRAKERAVQQGEDEQLCEVPHAEPAKLHCELLGFDGEGWTRSCGLVFSLIVPDYGEDPFSGGSHPGEPAPGGFAARFGGCGCGSAV